MNIAISHFPELIASMSDNDLTAFLGCVRREEEDLLARLYHLRTDQAALNAERDKRRANRRESLREKG